MNSSLYALGDRTLKFSKKTLLFCATIRVNLVTRPLITQLVRSASSIGANYAEANNASSRQDFRKKIFIAKKEAAETKYWLELLSDYTDDKAGLKELQTECQLLLMTLQKIINTLNRQKTENRKP